MSQNYKLWNKEGVAANSIVEEFTVGQDRVLDLQLAKYDALGSLAHIEMLESIGLLTKQELDMLTVGLNEILITIEKGEFIIEEGVEDVHSEIELMLTQKLGEVGKKIHSGRSRNDQVLVDLKLFYRQSIKDIATTARALFDQLIALSEKHKADLMPGYTHLQLAMPSSFGLWFGAYAESIADDMLLLEAAYKMANQNPLGSAAGYGSSFPLDREMTTRLLGFETMHFNSISAQMSRGKAEKSLSYAISALASSLGHFAMDVCLYMGQNYGFISFPDNLTTGSSIMPHKKNPDVFELIRAKCNMLQATPNEITLLTANLPTGYHRDLQMLKDITFPSIANIQYVYSMALFMLQSINIKSNILSDDKYNHIFTVEDVNKLVLQGIPFRDAYQIIGNQVQQGTYISTRDIAHTHTGSISNLSNDKIIEKMDKSISRILS